MRIAFVTWEALHGVAVGAAAVYSHRLAAALAARGHEVHLFTRLGEGQRLDDRIDGLRYHRVPGERRIAFLDEIRALAAPFGHYLREESGRGGPFDVLHAVDWLSLPAAFGFLNRPGAGADGARTRLAVTFHNTEWGRAGAWPERGHAAEIAALEREGAARADAVAVVSDRVRRELDALYHPPDWKADTIRHGLDTAPFRDADFDPQAVRRAAWLPPRGPVLLMSARLDGRRKERMILEAFARCHRRIRAAEADPAAAPRLVVAGDGPARPALLGEVERLGLAGEVLFTGRRTGADLAGLYRVADLVLSPADAFGAGALSAWAAGRPALAGAGSGSAEVVLDNVNGWILPDDPGRWAECVAAALREPERLRWMGANGRAALETAFTWEIAADRTLELYGRRDRLARQQGNTKHRNGSVIGSGR